MAAEQIDTRDTFAALTDALASLYTQAKWGELFTDATYTDGRFTTSFKAPEKITGDASICVVRGKKRFLYDFNFTLPFEVSLDGSVYKGSYTMHEISNDEDYEVRIMNAVVLTLWC